MNFNISVNLQAVYSCDNCLEHIMRSQGSVGFPNNVCSGGGPVHARVPIHAHPQFSSKFMIFHSEDVYHIIDNHQIDHTHLKFIV